MMTRKRKNCFRANDADRGSSHGKTVAIHTDEVEEKSDEDSATVKFSFPRLVTGDKRKLAKVSPVFAAQFKWNDDNEDDKTIEIQDCSSKTFASFINIIEGNITLSTILSVSSLSELFEMYYLVEKYQIDMDGLQKSLRKEINKSNINQKNLPRIIEIIESYKQMTVFEEVCEDLKMRCVNFVWRHYKTVDEVYEMLDGIGQSDNKLVFRLLKEMHSYKKTLCLNCFELKEKCKNKEMLDVMEIRPGIQIEYKIKDNSYGDGEIIALAGEAHNSSGETIAMTLYIKWDDQQDDDDDDDDQVYLPATIDVKADNTQFSYRCT